MPFSFNFLYHLTLSIFLLALLYQLVSFCFSSFDSQINKNVISIILREIILEIFRFFKLFCKLIIIEIIQFKQLIFNNKYLFHIIRLINFILFNNLCFVFSILLSIYFQLFVNFSQFISQFLYL